MKRSQQNSYFLNENCSQSQGLTKPKHVILGTGPKLFSSNIAHELRVLGYEVQTCATPEEARRLSIRHDADLVLLPFHAHDVLSVAKIVNAVNDRTEVLLIDAQSYELFQHFGEMIGVQTVTEVEGVQAIVAAIHETLTSCNV